MKTTLLLTSLIALFLNSSSLFSQDACKVLKPEIADKYEGSCKNGLANGKGSATGRDTYVGKFKNGLPEGEGKYTWASGEIYEGTWKAGLREGKGKLNYKVAGADSVKNGYWANDAFVRKIVPNPYTVLRKESVSRYSVRRIGDGQKVVFTIMQNGSTTFNFSNLLITPSSGSSFRLGQNHGYESIDFPFHCRITFNAQNSYQTGDINVEFEIQIVEPGSWEVTLNL
jgi:hypothetical protein